MFAFRKQSRPVRQNHPAARSLLQVEQLERREVMTAALWQIGTNVINTSQTFLLHSNPTAKHTIFLDFDGHTTGNVTGRKWDYLTSPAWDYSGNGASFTTTELEIIQRVWARVSEDFAPFNVDVTTQDPGSAALIKSGSTDDRWGIRVVITPDDRPAPGSGGVAYIGSFNFSDGTPVYVFNVGEKGVAEAASHEVGHSLGLNHDGTSSLGYYSGHGSGETSWGPIMGASYDPNVTQWSKGEYSGANNSEDDLSKITTLNGFTYRSDDFGSTLAGASSLLPQGASQVTPLYGLIERNTDADWYSFWSNAGSIALNVNPLPLGPNLAVRADLYNSNGTLLATFNPAGVLNAAVNFNVPSAGQYFLKVTGTGKGDPLSNGFSSYASLGNYRITGTVQAYTDGGGGSVNLAPTANSDSTSTAYGTAVTVNVLANDTDPENDTLVITDVSDFQGGTATIVGSSVLFTPTAGFSGNGSFTYTISDGNGNTASATASVTVATPSSTQSFTNDTDVTISSTSRTTISSSINVSGLSGNLQDVNVRLNVYHTYVSDLTITLVAPDGTRVILFNRTGSSGDNLLGTTFDSAASVAISSGTAPYTGSFRPYQALTGLNGKNANGTWRLEIRDNATRDGGRLDNWSLDLQTSGAAPASPGRTVSVGFGAPGATAQSGSPTAFDAVQAYWNSPHSRAESYWAGSQAKDAESHHQNDFPLESDLPPAPEEL